MSSPIVSIIIPAYNAAETIAATLDSCLAQTYDPCEIIVVDDGSTDETAAIVSDIYADHGVHLIQQRNLGPSIARHRGAQAANGRYLQFCDADDRLLPEKVARCLAVFDDHPEAGMVYTRHRHYYPDGRVLDDETAPINSDDFFCATLHANGSPIASSAALIKRTVYNDVGGFRVDDFQRCAEDWDLFLRIAARYQCVGLDAVLVEYRHRPDGLTSDALAMAVGRLLTLQHARDYLGRERCVDDATFDRWLAGRHHALALAYWRRQKTREARAALRNALHLEPSQMRRLFVILTYFAPASWADRLTRWRSQQKDEA